MRLLAGIACALSVAAQQPQFGIQSRLVLVPVSVTDSGGRSAEGLRPPDFLLYDNGVRREVTVDTSATGVAPIALVVAVQASGISAAVLAKVQKIGAMIQPLITGERGCAALVAFDESVRWLQECTKDADAIGRAFDRLAPGEYKRARMLDAAHAAIDRLRKRENVRRVLLLISESRDRGSESELPSVLLAAQAAGVTVYAASYSAFKTAFTSKPAPPERPAESGAPRATRTEPLSTRGRVPIPPPEQRVDILGGIGELTRLGKTKDIEVLTTQTGGTAFPFAVQKGLENAIVKLGNELQTQYVLSFSAHDSAPGRHELKVVVARAGKWRIRSRPAYWAQP